MNGSLQTKDGRQFSIELFNPSETEQAYESFRSVVAERVFLLRESITRDEIDKWSAGWSENGVNSLFLVARLSGTIIGGITLTKDSSSPKIDHVRTLGIWLLREYRGFGIGMALVQNAIDWARSVKTLRKIILGVWSVNEPAISLYRKTGFSVDGVRRGMALIDGNYVDEVLMSLDLRSQE